MPDCLHNHGNYVISLGDVCKWLAQQAEALGVEIFPGFAAAEVLYTDDGAVRGVATGNMGIGKDGEPHDGFQLGMELLGKYTMFAEGARGHLGKQLIAKFQLDAGRDPQSYAIGIKELWEIDPAKAKPGLVVHTAGWPMDSQTYGGGFLYHLEGNKVTLGLGGRPGLQQPLAQPLRGDAALEDAPEHPRAPRRRQAHRLRRARHQRRRHPEPAQDRVPGRRAGGLRCRLPERQPHQGQPRRDQERHARPPRRPLPRCRPGASTTSSSAYPEAFKASWLHEELDRSRNFKQWFKKGAFVGALMTGIEQWLLPKLGIKSPPWTIHRKQPDHLALRPAAECPPIDYPKPDGKLTFDRLSSVFISNTNHEENQPAHLTLKDASVPVSINLAKYAGPESRYCPAGVYEFVKNEDDSDRLQINAQNCVHCKTCDIKDPTQNIVWVTPEGGGGPNYAGM